MISVMVQPSSASAMATPLQLLSVAPCFDGDLGAELVSLARPDPGADFPREYLKIATNHGLVEPVSSLKRVSAMVQRPLMQSLRENNDELYKSALTAFLSHADSDMAEPLATIFGSDGSEVIRETFRVIVSLDPARQFLQLDDLLKTNGQRGRWADHVAAANLLEKYGDSNNRVTHYLRAMSLWHQGKRSQASEVFELVLAGDPEDRMAGVAGHLRGTLLHKQGKTREAIELLQRARDVLDSINDDFGYTVTTTTQSRVVLDRFRSLRDEQDLVKANDLAVDAVRRAEDQLRGGEDRECAHMLSSSHIALANVRVEQRKLELAAESALAAVRCSLPGTLDELKSNVVYSRVLRDLGNGDDNAAGILRNALNVFDARGQSNLRHKAMALNVLASIEKSFSPETAFETASESLDIGEVLRDNRHIAHSLLTLVQIELTLERWTTLTTQERRGEFRRMKGQLFRSRKLLVDLNDVSGKKRVEDVIAQLEHLQLS